jgi:hypothetical protein
MKICAITMVYKDYWALSQWYAHYSKHIGAENIYIVVHGYDEKIAELCPEATIKTTPRVNLSNFDRNRSVVLNELQDSLSNSYDWVIRTDADELICFDPFFYNSFINAFEKFKNEQVIFAVGINLIEAAEDTELYDTSSVFANRQNAIFSGHYSKAFATKYGVHLARHGFIARDDIRFYMPKGVYLVHLKYSNTDALQKANDNRKTVAHEGKTGMPGTAWKQPNRPALIMLNEIETLPFVDWDISSKFAYETLSAGPELEADKGIVRTKSVKFETRTKLPNWFKDY